MKRLAQYVSASTASIRAVKAIILAVMAMAVVSVTPIAADADDPPAILEFWLVDANSDVRITQLEDYDVLRLPFLPYQLSIEAVADGSTDSVLMQIDYADASTENFAPYALRGDASGDFNPVPELRNPGWITVSAQAFTGPDNSGDAGTRADLHLYLHQPDFVVRNSADIGDFDPGDGVCSIGPRLTLATDLMVRPMSELPENELQLISKLAEPSAEISKLRAAELAPMIEADQKRSSAATMKTANEINPRAMTQIAQFTDQMKQLKVRSNDVDADVEIKPVDDKRKVQPGKSEAESSLKELRAMEAELVPLNGDSFALASGYDISRFEPQIPFELIPNWFPLRGCTLRAAVEEANALPGKQSILIDSAKGPFMLTKGDIDITGSVDLIGIGQRALIDADDRSRIFNVSGDHIVNMRSLDLARGQAGVASRGGAMRITDDALVQMSDSIVRESQANFGGGIYLQTGGDLTLTDSAVRDNIAGTPEDGISGGGITQRGGGIFNLEGIVNIRDSAIFDNLAVRGGGLSNFGGTMRVENSSVIDNEALAIGGGIENKHNSGEYGNLHLAFATVANNQAGTSFAPPGEQRVGGGLYNTGWAYMASSILADNTDGWSAGDALHAPDCYSPDQYDFKSYRNNVVGVLNDNCDLGDYSWGTTAWIDHGTEFAPLDARLTNKFSWDHRHYRNLHADSPAVDEGASASASLYPCADNDGRDRARPVGDGCDIGSIERQ